MKMIEEHMIPDIDPGNIDGELPSSVAAEKNTHRLTLDEARIEQILKSYPQQVHEHVRWLGRFVRERCDRSLALLEQHCRAVKLNPSRSYFYKIMTGRYFGRYPEGHARAGEMIGDAAKFARIVEALQTNYRQMEDRRSGMPFAITETGDLIRDYITARRAPGRPCGFGLILGATGREKSYTVKQYRRDVNDRAGGRNLCIYLDAPDTPTMSKFTTKLALECGSTLASNQQAKRGLIYTTVTPRHTIIVDNIQRLLHAKKTADQPIFNHLQELQDEVGCSVIMIGNRDFRGVLEAGVSRDKSSAARRNYFEQFIGRIGGMENVLEVEDFATTRDIHCVVRDYGLKGEAGAYDYLRKLSQKPGRDRVMFNALFDGIQLATSREQKLTLQHVLEANGEKV